MRIFRALNQALLSGVVQLPKGKREARFSRCVAYSASFLCWLLAASVRAWKWRGAQAPTNVLAMPTGNAELAVVGFSDAPRNPRTPQRPRAVARLIPSADLAAAEPEPALPFLLTQQPLQERVALAALSTRSAQEEVANSGVARLSRGKTPERNAPRVASSAEVPRWSARTHAWKTGAVQVSRHEGRGAAIGESGARAGQKTADADAQDFAYDHNRD